MRNRRAVRRTWRRESEPPTKPTPALARALEQDKEVDARSSTQAELDGERNVDSASLEVTENAA